MGRARKHERKAKNIKKEKKLIICPVPHLLDNPMI